MTTEKEVSLSDDPQAQELWDQIEAEERGDAAPPPKDEPGTAAAAAEVVDDAGPAHQADPAPEDDPYAGLPQKVRDEIFGLRNTVQQLSGRVRNAEGHIGGLRTQLQRDLQAAATAAAKAGSDAPTSEQIGAASKSPAALAKLVEDYPEFGGAVKEAMDAQAQEIAALRETITRRPQVDEGQATAALKDQLIDLTIRTKHPAWKQDVTAPDFDQWVARQPREVQALRNSNDPEDVIRLLDIRTAQTQAKTLVEQKQDRATQQRRTNALRAAGIPAGRSAASIASKDLDALSPEELWRHLDEVESAK